MKIYSQQDPLWKHEFIGQTKFTIEYFGCTLSCVAMIATYFGDNFTPSHIAKKCKYTGDARIYWQSVDFPHFRFFGRYYSYYPSLIDKALKDPNLAVILQVNNEKHWVVATGKTWFSDKYKIADPIDGSRATLARYGNKVNGFAVFARK